jgi:hypothetical protein
MDLRFVVPFLARKFSRANNVRQEMIASRGADAVGYSTVLKYLGAASSAPETPDTLVSEEFRVIDEAILKALEQTPFFSVRELARFTRLAPSTVYRHLT